MPEWAWPSHKDTHDCHEEHRDSGALPGTRDTTPPAPGNLGTQHGVAAVNPAVTLLMQGQQTSDGARALLPPTLVVLHHASAFDWVQLSGRMFCSVLFCVWLRAKEEEEPCSQTCGLPPSPSTSLRRAMHTISRKHQDAYCNCSSSSVFRRCFTENQRKQLIGFLSAVCHSSPSMAS